MAPARREPVPFDRGCKGRNPPGSAIVVMVVVVSVRVIVVVMMVMIVMIGLFFRIR